MHTVRFPYGEGFVDLELTEEPDLLMPEWVPGVPDELEAVRRAMAHPVGSERLVRLAAGKSGVAIVINDITRPSPTETMLTAILEELTAAGISREKVTVIVANGNHLLATEEELKKIMGVWFSKLKIVNHDCRDQGMLTYVGTTKRGLPLYVNRNFTEAPLKILTGVITPHQSAGFGGGRKSVVPGISGLETITKLHSFPIRPDGPVLGMIHGNRFHDEVVAAARMAGTDFIVNVIKNYHGEMVGAVAGELEKAHLRGVEICEKTWVRKVKKAYDVVFVGAGRYPKDVDLHQAQKGLVVAEQVTRPGGTIVLIAQCRNGIGKFGKVLKEADSIAAVIQDFLESGSSEDNKGKAYLFARCCQDHRVLVVTSGIDSGEIAEMFMTGFTSLSEAAMTALSAYPDPSVLCIPYAGECIPVIAPDLDGL
ncbi:MAG: nickel-dependent lactate racemase [Syntrophales bacterium]|nr:nickel-dependent lactate racemase [Syntrophales bacterium]